MANNVETLIKHLSQHVFRGRHPETDGQTERVNITSQHPLSSLYCYDGSDRMTLLPLVEFTYNASRAHSIEHRLFHTNLNFTLEVLLSMRPSIHISRDATKRLILVTRTTYSCTFGATFAERLYEGAFMSVDNATFLPRRTTFSDFKGLLLTRVT
jgi:hypothetical protein